MNNTDRVLLGAVTGLLLYEGYTVFNKTKDDTESESIWRILPRRPIVPFVLGFTLGHFVWQSQDVYDAILKAEFKRELKEAQKALKEIK